MAAREHVASMIWHVSECRSPTLHMCKAGGQRHNQREGPNTEDVGDWPVGWHLTRGNTAISTLPHAKPMHRATHQHSQDIQVPEGSLANMNTQRNQWNDRVCCVPCAVCLCCVLSSVCSDAMRSAGCVPAMYCVLWYARYSYSAVPLCCVCYVSMWYVLNGDSYAFEECDGVCVV